MRRDLPVRHRALQSSGRGPVHLRVIEAGSDHATIELGVDYSKADVPDRSYYADYCDIQRARVGLSLVFGKLIPGTPRLRTKLEISFPDEMFTRQLWGTSRGFHETVRKLAERERFSSVSTVEDTDKVQTFRSNNVFMGVWGEEAVLDFYYISPRDMHMLNSGQTADVGLEPVVRVVMGTALMAEFLEKCRVFLPADIGAAEVSK